MAINRIPVIYNVTRINPRPLRLRLMESASLGAIALDDLGRRYEAEREAILEAKHRAMQDHRLYRVAPWSG